MMHLHSACQTLFAVFVSITVTTTAGAQTLPSATGRLIGPAGCTAIFPGWDRERGPDWESFWLISDVNECTAPAHSFVTEEPMELCDLSLYAGHLEGTNYYNISIHEDDGGVPGTVVGSFEFRMLPEGNGGPVEASVLDGSGICLDAGVHWISIVPAAQDGTTMGALYWSTVPGLDSQHAEFDCSNWTNLGFETPGAIRIAARPGCGGDDFYLSYNGSCPGEMKFIGHNSTPGGDVAFLYAFGTGQITVPGGPCAGMRLGLNRTARVAGIVTADDDGLALLTGNVPQGACRRIFVQAVDIETCTPSNVEPI